MGKTGRFFVTLLGVAAFNIKFFCDKVFRNRAFRATTCFLILATGLSSAMSFVFSTHSLAEERSALKKPALKKSERLITLLQTNDIHGGVDPVRVRGTRWAGGFDYWAGVVDSIREGIENRYGDSGAVFLVDAGDQFQGTLISNYNEGELVFKMMSEMKYDAVVPGNHDYDFGPTGWLDDRVHPDNPDKNPRGSLMKILRRASFSFLAANVYEKQSLVDGAGKRVDVDREDADLNEIDWKSSKRATFLKPYTIIRRADVRVAFIGMDHPRTPVMTTPENVSDLYFRDVVDTYLEVYDEIKNSADVFVLVMHGGNTSTESEASDIVKRLTNGGKKVDVFVGGHTHYINETVVNEVPIIQSGNGGDQFGRIDLVWDVEKRELDLSQTKIWAGVYIYHEGCTSDASFCELSGDQVFYEGVKLRPNSNVSSLIEKARKDVSPLADRHLGHAHGEIWRHRIFENPLIDSMTDVLRELTGADVALMNTSGLRANLLEGEITYEDFFKVLPFSNRGVVIGPMEKERLIALLKRSIRSCGAYGALIPSGLRVTFERDCSNRSNNGVDYEAELSTVKTIDGEWIYDRSRGGDISNKETFEVATFDFLHDGGSGYDDFRGVPIITDYGIIREAFANLFYEQPRDFYPEKDGRWRDYLPAKSRNPSLFLEFLNGTLKFFQ